MPAPVTIPHSHSIVLAKDGTRPIIFTIRSGGESDKLASRYESCWTIYNLLSLLRGECEELRVEPLQQELGVEFIKVLNDGGTEFHSVKIQTTKDVWTVPMLTSEKENERSILGVWVAKTRKLHSCIRAAKSRGVLCDAKRPSVGGATCQRRGEFRDRTRSCDIKGEPIGPAPAGERERCFGLRQRGAYNDGAGRQAKAVR